jgi:hypothetical protein
VTRYLKAFRRKSYYALQKTTRLGVDRTLEPKARERADEYLRHIGLGTTARRPLRRVELASIDLENRDRYPIARGDVYKRFVAHEDGADVDRFGRKGSWRPRGCVLYRDTQEHEYLKIFEPHFSTNGEGRYLQSALDAGCYDFLSPGLTSLVVDEQENLRGYSICEGTALTPYEFERLVGSAYRELVIEVTRRTGYYFYDLAFHNVVRHDGELSLIDLESVLPVEWYGQDIDFARARLDEIDIGKPLQEKWHSPRWYAEFLDSLKRESSPDMTANPAPFAG